MVVDGSISSALLAPSLRGQVGELTPITRSTLSPGYARLRIPGMSAPCRVCLRWRFDLQFACSLVRASGNSGFAAGIDRGHDLLGHHVVNHMARSRHLDQPALGQVAVQSGDPSSPRRRKGPCTPWTKWSRTRGSSSAFVVHRKQALVRRRAQSMTMRSSRSVNFDAPVRRWQSACVRRSTSPEPVSSLEAAQLPVAHASRTQAHRVPAPVGSRTAGDVLEVELDLAVAERGVGAVVRASRDAGNPRSRCARARLRRLRSAPP